MYGIFDAHFSNEPKVICLPSEMVLPSNLISTIFFFFWLFSLLYMHKIQELYNNCPIFIIVTTLFYRPINIMTVEIVILDIVVII